MLGIRSRADASVSAPFPAAGDFVASCSSPASAVSYRPAEITADQIAETGEIEAMNPNRVMLRAPNFGRKSLNEIKKVLAECITRKFRGGVERATSALRAKPQLQRSEIEYPEISLAFGRCRLGEIDRKR